MWAGYTRDPIYQLLLLGSVLHVHCILPADNDMSNSKMSKTAPICHLKEKTVQINYTEEELKALEASVENSNTKKAMKGAK